MNGNSQPHFLLKCFIFLPIFLKLSTFSFLKTNTSILFQNTFWKSWYHNRFEKRAGNIGKIQSYKCISLPKRTELKSIFPTVCEIFFEMMEVLEEISRKELLLVLSRVTRWNFGEVNLENSFVHKMFLIFLFNNSYCRIYM